MWLIVKYLPTTLFSLRKSDATNTAAKSLIAPSPYSIKMALLNSIITFDSLKKAKENFDFIKSLEIQYALSKYICINNCFIKIQKQPHSDKLKTNPSLAFDSSIGFREYIFFNDKINIAFKIEHKEQKGFLDMYLRKINYFGKRGCFFQYIESSIIQTKKLPTNYSDYFNKESLNLSIDGLIMKMDDFDPKVKFNEVNTFTNNKTKREERIYYFKYENIKSSKQYTLLKQTV